MKFCILCVSIIVRLFAQSDTLTLEQCVNTALKNSPLMKIAAGARESSVSAVTASRSALFPQFNYQAGWSKNGGTTIIGRNQIVGNIENYTTGIQAQQLIYDFGRTSSKLNAAESSAASAEYEFTGAMQTLIVNVTAAFYGYLQSLQLREINEEALKLAADHLTQAQGFFNAGKKPAFDVVKAETDLANAKLNLIKAQNAMRIARLQLEHILSVKLAEECTLKEQPEQPAKTIELPDAFATALQHRPEVRASRSKLETARSLASAAWSNNLPTVNATGGYNWRGFSLDKQLQPSWNLGLALALPLFQGFAAQAGYEQASAAVKISEGQYESVLQAVRLDVEQQYYLLQEAGQRLETADLVVKQAKETFRLAQGRYAQDVGSPMEVADAEMMLLNAKTAYTQARYDRQVAYVKLKRAMGILE
jgi:outer membrane protein TolC